MICLPLQKETGKLLELRDSYHLTSFFFLQYPFGFSHQDFLCLFQLTIRFRKAFDQKSCCSCRGFHTPISHPVHDRLITFMPDSGKNRDRELRYVGSQLVRIKTTQIRLWTSPSNNYHHIKKWFKFVNPFQRGNDWLGRFLSLHNGRK